VSFQRYRPFISDWEAFSRALLRPEPRTFRARRTHAVSTDELKERLEAQGFQLSPSPHLSGVFRVDQEPFPLSETLEHWLGLLYIQQTATALAPPLLAPHPGEGILDLCAAPGGKSAHLADPMGDRGLIVAVDSSEPRLRALSGNLSRLTLSSVVAVKARGERIPTGAGFHRVLVDVPCSGEGRSRRGEAPQVASPGDLKRLPRLQEALLRKAVEVTVPGGRILYVTCTLAPEENEAVVDRVLREEPVTLVPLAPDVPHAPGLTRFQDLRFLPELSGACRIHPHHLDSGGLFLALLERDGGPAVEDALHLPGWTSLNPSPPAVLAPWVRNSPALQERGWVERGEMVRMLGLPAWPLEEWLREAPGLPVIHTGLRAVSWEKRGDPRPSVDLLRWLGADAPTGAFPALSLTREEWLRLLSGRELRKGEAPDGAVALTLDGQVLGRGRLRKGRVLAELSPPRADWLRQVLAQSGPEPRD
jgi:16S rRNA C967 or C1407 C5-methylase (RsmB/RsmF family)